MKVQCDFCSKETASVFCCADEAALCDGCDRRIHRANKLAGRHRRLSLIHPSDSSMQSTPLCDICQEKRGFLFCQEDRAILCRDCDLSIHTASDLTMKHNRYLLTGIKLSSTPIVSTSLSIEVEEVDKIKHEKEVIVEEEATSSVTAVSNSSSISEYLTKMLPGWHVEDFLIDDAAATAANGFYQGEVNTSGLSQGFPIWVPQVPQIHNEWKSNKRSRASFCYW
ncbi:B-box zinc finger protein 23-like [Typha angustifolia]|uniref:B-box zinc finger protein 23-like n=1 Tax=Typha angustifolia TaxID=59011 RepID=UPI003C2EB272